MAAITMKELKNMTKQVKNAELEIKNKISL